MPSFDVFYHSRTELNTKPAKRVIEIRNGSDGSFLKAPGKRKMTDVWEGLVMVVSE